jgi:hypothetical protein
MTLAAEAMLSLVCGLPVGSRERRRLLMLKAFIDDSKTKHGTPHVFVLAGYIASAETWMKFSDEWQAALDLDPRIRYFKLREAMRGIDQFYGRRWTQAKRHERITVFRGLIEKFVQAEIAIGFVIESYQKAYAAWGPKHRNPYYFASAALTAETARNLDKLGLPREPIDFVFDTQVMEMGKVVEGWQWARDRARPDPPDLLDIHRNAPVFADDETVLPLQAADMHATWMRELFEKKLRKEEPKAVIGFKKNVPRSMIMWFPETTLRDRAKEDLEKFYTRPEFW